MRRMFCKNQRSRAIECLLTESHIHGNMYVWFGGRHGETSHRNMVWRPVSSLHRRNSDTKYFIELRPIGKSGQMGAGIPVTYEFMNTLLESYTEEMSGIPAGRVPENMLACNPKKDRRNISGTIRPERDRCSFTRISIYRTACSICRGLSTM